MRPIKLTMTAFGPYKDTETVDFTRFERGKPYLITGDTGAGKSTIFDAVCYALYGEPSGELRSGASLRSDYADPSTLTGVELVFECRGQRYTVFRRPAYRREKRRGEGTIEESAYARLELPDGGAENRDQAVTKKIESIVGVDRRQFKQIAMIAQGEFRRLLSDRTSERGEIFSRLFGTGMLKEFTSELKRRSDAAADDLRYCGDRIRSALNGSDCGAEKDRITRLTSGEITEEYIGEAEDVISAMIGRDRALAGEISEELTELESRSIILAGKAEICARDNALIDSAQKRASELEAFRKGDKALEEDRVRASAAAKAAVEVKPACDARLRAEKALADKRSEIERLKSSLELASRKEDRLKLELEEAKKLEPEIPALAAEITAVKADEPLYGELDALSLRLAELTEKLDRENALRDRSAARLKEYRDRGAKLGEKLKELEGAAVRAEKARAALERAAESSDAASSLSDKLKSYIEGRKEIECCESSMKAAETAYETAASEYSELSVAYFRCQAGILAGKLEKGKPCPVCGSTEHPSPAALESGAPDEKSLEEAKKKEEYRRKILGDLASMLSGKKGRSDSDRESLVSSADRLIGGVDKGADDGELSALISAAAERSLRSLEQARAENDGASAALKKYSALTEDAEKLSALAEKEAGTERVHADAAAKLSEEVSGARAELETRRSSLRYPDRASAMEAVSAAEKRSEAISAGISSAETALRRASDETAAAGGALVLAKGGEGALVSAAEEAETSFRTALARAGFENEEDYLSSVMSDSDLRRLEDSISEREKRRAILEENLRQAEIQARGLVRADAEVIKRELEECRAQAASKRAEENAVKTRISLNEAALESAGALAEERKRLAARSETLGRLYRTADGRLTGAAKLKFEQYVQGRYLDMIVRAANRRFDGMTQGQFRLLRRPDDGASGNRSVGLDLDVYDAHTGRVRSSDTLSGGESFMAALALALGLSDVVSRRSGGIKLDSMFIDEGFGSLDREHLALAVRALTTVAGGDVLVGVISHVEELRNGIEPKITVTRGRDGSHISVEV